MDKNQELERVQRLPEVADKMTTELEEFIKVNEETKKESTLMNITIDSNISLCNYRK